MLVKTVSLGGKHTSSPRNMLSQTPHTFTPAEAQVIIVVNATGTKDGETTDTCSVASVCVALAHALT